MTREADSHRARFDLSEAVPLAGAAWGFAGGFAALPFLRGLPPSASQLPGEPLLLQQRASSAYIALFLLFFASMAGAALGRVLGCRLREVGSERWATIAILCCGGLALWGAVAPASSITLAILPAALGAIAIMRARHLRLAFDRADLVLLPTVAVCYFALLDVFARRFTLADLSTSTAPSWFLEFALAIVLGIRVVAVMLQRGKQISPGSLFLGTAAAAFLELRYLPIAPRIAGGLALGLIIATPLTLARLARDRDRSRMRQWVAFAAFPLLCAVYPQLYAFPPIEHGYRVDYFEDGHSLLPASEMFRGERFYRDIVPGHGLLSDGGIDYAIFRLRGPAVRKVFATRAVMTSLNPVAMYALALAASGSPEVGLLAVLVSCAMIPTGVLFTRTFPAFLALAAAASGVRRRNVRMFFAAGALLVLAGLMSLDFGVFSAVAVFVALFRWSAKWEERRRALLMTAGGFFSAFIPLLITLAAKGILVPFFRVPIVEFSRVTQSYGLAFPIAPPAFTTHPWLPGLLSTVFDHESFVLLAWVFIAIHTATLLVSRGNGRRETRNLLGVWITVAALSYAYRHHTSYFEILIPLFLTVAVFELARHPGSPHRPAALALASVIVILSNPTSHLFVAMLVRSANGIIEPGLVRYDDVPRSRGAILPRDNAEKLRIVQHFLQTRLRPDETFFDFSNSPILYYLFDKPCPIRQSEVPFFQTPELQREVIARLEADRSVAVALMRLPNGGSTAIDGVENSLRVPLVWSWLQANFEPSFEQDGVVFWRRKPARGAPS